MHCFEKGVYICRTYEMHGPCRRVASWGLKGSVQPLIFVHKKFLEGAWIIGFRVCVRVAGAVPDTSYHGKQKEEFIWYSIWKYFLNIPSKPTQVSFYSWPTCVVGKFQF